MSWWMAFAYPWVLPLVLVVVPLVWWAWLSERRRAPIRFSNVSRIPGAPVGNLASRPWSLRARTVLPVLRSLAVILLVVSIARPRKADELTRIQTEGVAIELVVDRSGSMDQEDFVGSRGRLQTRLQAVKEVVRNFVQGDDGGLRGRQGDLLGLTVFARYPDTECPLTRDHANLLSAMNEVQVPRTQDEDGTAIGDALLLAVERIRNIGRRLLKSEDFKIKSRAIILLTDGQQNYGKYTPTKAAEAAKALGIKVYTIGAAPRFQERRIGPFSLGSQPVPIDEASLKQVAEMTGGKYFRATDAGSLAAIYAEIDKMERSTIDEQQYYRYEELAYQWMDLGRLRLPPLLLMALILLGLESLLANTRFRKIP